MTDYINFDVKHVEDATSDVFGEQINVELEGVSLDIMGYMRDDDTTVCLMFDKEDVEKLVEKLKEALEDAKRNKQKLEEE